MTLGNTHFKHKYILEYAKVLRIKEEKERKLEHERLFKRLVKRYTEILNWYEDDERNVLEHLKSYCNSV